MQSAENKSARYPHIKMKINLKQNNYKQKYQPGMPLSSQNESAIESIGITPLDSNSLKEMCLKEALLSPEQKSYPSKLVPLTTASALTGKQREYQ